VLIPTSFVSHGSFISLGSLFPSVHVRQGPRGESGERRQRTNDSHDHDDDDPTETTTTPYEGSVVRGAPGSDAPESESIRERMGVVANAGAGAGAIRRGCFLTQ
jgi:hypothetical protein